MARPYRAWGYPWTPGLALASSIVFLAGAAYTDRQHTLGAGHTGSRLSNFPGDEIIFAPSQRVALLLDLFRNRLRLQKEVQVVFAARLRIRSRHIESAKRMRAHHRARAFPV